MRCCLCGELQPYTGSHVVAQLQLLLFSGLAFFIMLPFLKRTLTITLDSDWFGAPLVAASMGMYSLEQYPPDSFLWEFMAYCAGTGGSILIIGSAAGVAAMGLEKIDFIFGMSAVKISGLAR